MSDSRAEFEAHIRATWKVPESYLDWALRLDEHGYYVDSRAADQWSGWQSGYQAARKAALEEAAKVCEDMHEEDRPSDYAYAIRSLADMSPT